MTSVEIRRARRRSALRGLVMCVAVLGAAAILATGRQQAATIEVSAKFYRLSAAIDVSTIKAIGSPDTKASPSVLQVTKPEADRVAKVVTDAGATLAGSPKVLTTIDHSAKVEVLGEESGYSLEVVPSNHGSDTISLKFKISVTTTDGQRRTTRSARGSARVQEAKSLLIIENPRSGQPGFLAIVEAKRT